MKTMKLIGRIALVLALSGCGVTKTTKKSTPTDDSNNNRGGGTTITWKQVERLARPAINEGLVISNANLNAFNSVPPTVDLTPPAAGVVSEAAAVLVALYAGACFTNGALTAALGGGAPQLKPAGRTCSQTGLAILNSNAIGLNSSFLADAQQYAGLVAGQFLPDVLRIDTVSGGNTYNGSLCNGAAAGSPLLCGGRKLDDNVMDITYAYLLNGEAAPSAISSIRNGTYYTQPVTGTASTSCAAGLGVNCTNTGNVRQGHKPVQYSAMPWSPSPY